MSAPSPCCDQGLVSWVINHHVCMANDAASKPLAKAYTTSAIGLSGPLLQSSV